MKASLPPRCLLERQNSGPPRYPVFLAQSSLRGSDLAHFLAQGKHSVGAVMIISLIRIPYIQADSGAGEKTGGSSPGSAN